MLLLQPLPQHQCLSGPITNIMTSTTRENQLSDFPRDRSSAGALTDLDRHQNHPSAGQQGYPTLQQQRSTGVVHERHPNSSYQPSNIHTTAQGPYLSPHSATPTISQHQSPYVLSHQNPGEANFFPAHPSPYSANSAAGSYTSSEPSEAMATQAAMNRSHYPPISTYQTPQSNSPASMHSPQADQHGRSVYGMSSVAQPLYYQQQYVPSSSYGQHQQPSPHHSITSAPGVLMSQQQQQQQQQPMHQQQQQQQQHALPPPPPPLPPPPTSQQLPGQPPSSMVDSKSPIASLQRPPSTIPQPHSTPQTPSISGIQSVPTSAGGQHQSAAPGPIPATTPLVVRQDGNGVQWIAFEYSRDRVKMEYTIRCDVESVNVEELSPEFKSANCVYPRACCHKDQYKGNRLHYESECNAVGWALAELNPPLREKRGLIQRAVDSWRNSNQDIRLRSRRVRRMAKISSRKMLSPSVTGQLSGQQDSPVVQNPQGMTPNPTMSNYNSVPQMRRMMDDRAEGSSGHVGAGIDYNTAPAHHHQTPSSNHPALTTPLSSTTSPRYAHNFYPTYPEHHSGGSGVPPSTHGPMDHLPSHSHSTPLAGKKRSIRDVDDEDEETEKNRMLFGNLPESKRRKFILVEDHQRNTRVRVRVMLDHVKMDDMPDAHLRINAVYPRSYFPRHVAPPRAHAEWDDDDDDVSGGGGGESSSLPPRGRTTVPVPSLDGPDLQMSVPRMTKSRRAKETALNELGCRMAWRQARTFNGRNLFLQRCLDAYRAKMRGSLLSDGQYNDDSIPPLFQTRPGKRKFLHERGVGSRASASASASASVSGPSGKKRKLPPALPPPSPSP